jgi:molybdopterin converting factor small subunit
MSSSVDQNRLLREALEQKYENEPKYTSRSSYTTRIMDIIKQVHKQKQEIRKIIQDIQVVQKQINFSSEKLKRSEAVADENLFRAAKKHEENSSKGSSSTYVESYRYFAEVREVFEELILIVADIGKKENAIRDLENWISHLKTRESGKNLARVINDLQVVRDENATLIKQLH